MDYIVVALMCVIAMFLGIVMLSENETLSKGKRRKLAMLALLIICEIMIDTFLFSVNDDFFVSPTICKILKITEFTLSPIILAIFSSIITRKNSWEKIRKLFILLISLNSIGQIITFFVPFMFVIDENSVYYRTQYTFIYIVILIIGFVLLGVSDLNSIIQNNGKISYTIIFTTFFLLLGIGIRAICPKNNSDWLCVTFGYLIFTIHFCNNYLKIDSLTSLLNRRAFDNKMATINYSTAIILIDANDFKQINDTYGHQSGDLALSKISETIFKVYSKIGYCYRIGGDEFCVILKQGMLQKLTYETENCDTYLMLENLTKLLFEEIKRVSEKYPILENGVSQGYGVYFSKKDMPTIQKSVTIEEVFEIADKRMYKNKANFKNAEECE